MSSIAFIDHPSPQRQDPGGASVLGSKAGIEDGQSEFDKELCEILACAPAFTYRSLAEPQASCLWRWLALSHFFPTLFAAMAERPEAEQERMLVEAAQRGDVASLRTLLERFAPVLYSNVILPRVGVAAEADEMLRDTLSRAAQKLDAFRWTGAGFFPWLRQIAINMIIDRARSRQRQAKMESSLAAHESTLQPMHHAGAEEAAIEQQERAIANRQLREALETLNERYRKAIEMRLIEELSREECAAALSVSVATFDVILHRALTALRKVYGLS